MSDYISREAFLAEQRHLYCENCARRKGIKNGKMKFAYEIGDAPCRACGIGDVLDDVENFPAADVRPVVRAEFVRCGDGKSVPFMCTHCGKTVPASLVEIWGANYCPKCGAMMEEN